MAELTSTSTLAKRLPTPSYSQTFQRLIKSWTWLPRLVKLSMVVFVLLVLPVLLADQLAPYDANEMHMLKRLAPPMFVAGGSSEYLLGTDAVGEIFSAASSTAGAFRWR